MANPQNNLEQDVLAEIKNRLDVVDVVSEHVLLKKSGKNYWGLCPFHKEKTPSFSVNPDKGIFKCFGCGAGGDSLSFLMKLNNTSFYETLTELAQKFGLEMPKFGGQSSEKTELKNQIYELNKAAAEFYNDLLLNSPEAQKAKEYLLNRGMDEDIIRNFKLGFAPKQYDGLINHLLEKYKANFELLDKAGLVSKKSDGKGYLDRFRNRIIVPIQDEKGNYIAFGARALEEGQNPKYLNSPETPVYNKSRTLFALYQAKDSIKENDSVILMEGYFDVISAHVHGLTNVVATSGTALTEYHLKMIARYTDSRRIYLAFDADDAGVSATSRGAEIIKSVFGGLGHIKQFDENYTSSSGINNRTVCEIRVINIPTGKDPDEFIKTEGIDAYKKLINNAPLLLDFQINEIIKSRGETTSPQAKANLIKEIIPILSEIKNSIVRNEYVKLISERLDVEEEALSMEVKKSLQNKVRTEKQEVQLLTKKKIDRQVLAQKNLLSLYFLDEEKISATFVNNYLKEINFLDPVYLLIKTEVEKIIHKVGSKEEMTEELFAGFANNEEAKQAIVDIIFSLDDKKCLDERLIKQFISENAFILQNLSSKEQEELRANYKTTKSDDLSSLQLQYKVKELIQQKQARLESINGKK